MDVRDGQYRASRIRGDEQDLRQGKEGWFGREGQPPGPSVTVTRRTQGGGSSSGLETTAKDGTHGPRWTPDAQGFPVLGSLTLDEKDRRDRAVPDCASAMVDKNSNLDPLWRPERDGSHQAPLGRFVRAPRWRMWPAGNSGSTRRVTPGRGNDATRRSAVQPLSVEAVEFSPALAPEQNLRSGRKTMSSGAGGVVPTVVVEPPLPTAGGGGVTFTAVAEVHRSASANEEDRLIVQSSG